MLNLENAYAIVKSRWRTWQKPHEALEIGNNKVQKVDE